jgi:hypothetical protein
VVISLDHTVVTGGFYLSSHTLYETIMGEVHAFVLPLLLVEGKLPSLTILIRRIVHYMHNAYVTNDSSDRSHLLTFSTLDNARDLFSLIATAILLNALDNRTYELSSETYQEDPTHLQQSSISTLFLLSSAIIYVTRVAFQLTFLTGFLRIILSRALI